MYYKAYIKIYESNNLLYTSHTTCMLENNILSYSTDTDNIKINLNKFKFTKENNDSLLIITEEACTLKLKEVNKTFDIELLELRWSYKYNNIIISYKLATQEEPIQIKIMIGSVINE